jgi:hypothetical protein
MADNQPFTIDKVEWHTQTRGNTETVDSIHRRFKVIISFLRENGLTTSPILSDGAAVTEDLAITSTDLTEDGLAIMRKCYDKWLQRVDQGMLPEDLSLFQKQLAKLRKN